MKLLKSLSHHLVMNIVVTAVVIASGHAIFYFLA